MVLFQSRRRGKQSAASSIRPFAPSNGLPVVAHSQFMRKAERSVGSQRRFPSSGKPPETTFDACGLYLRSILASFFFTFLLRLGFALVSLIALRLYSNPEISPVCQSLNNCFSRCLLVLEIVHRHFPFSPSSVAGWPESRSSSTCPIPPNQLACCTSPTTLETRSTVPSA